MSRGHYGFQDETEYLTYKNIISVIVKSLINNTALDSAELTHIDISPAQVIDIVEELGWYRIERSQDRDTRWEYFENDTYPGKMMSLVSDIDLFSLTMDVFDKEEE